MMCLFLGRQVLGRREGVDMMIEEMGIQRW